MVNKNDTDKPSTGKIRLQKALSDNGYMSRRKAEELIANGKITVNGRKVEPGFKVDTAKDIVSIDGNKIALKRKKKLYYVALNKPRGYITTTKDELERKCIIELVRGIPERLYPVGRLDKQSEGLLFLTNDGDFANAVTHPKYHIEKIYRVSINGRINDEQIVKLRDGVIIDGKKTAPTTVEIINNDENNKHCIFHITLREGRNRQVRKMCEAVGLEVSRLTRIAIGSVRLAYLKSGKYRMLTRQEIESLLNHKSR